MTIEPGEFQYAVDTTLSVPPTRIVAVHGTRMGDAAPAQRLRLGEALVAAGVITPTQLEACLRDQASREPRRRLGAVVVERGLATDVQVAQGLGTILGFEYVDPVEMEVPVDVARRVPRLSAQMLGVVPIGAGETWLRVAVADPTDRHMVESLREVTGLINVSLTVATPRSIDAALDRFWEPDYAPEPEPAAIAAVPDLEPEEVAEPEQAEEPGEEVADEPWEYTLIGDAMPIGHAGYTTDLAAMEAELARLGRLGWEAVGLSPSGTRTAVLLKRRVAR